MTNWLECTTRTLYVLLILLGIRPTGQTQALTPCQCQPTIPANWFTHDANVRVVPVGGNSWVVNPAQPTETITNDGLMDWTDPQTILTTYVRVSQGGTLKVSANLSVPDGQSTFQMTIAGKRVSFTAAGSNFTDYMIDTWSISQEGYLRIDLQGTAKTGTSFASVANLSISGTAVTDQVVFVPTNADNNFYWGRRGPSVHLRYTVPSAVTWFYNELTIPTGLDPVGSYFMANGFAEGYFGMQVNSPTERRVLFSVWDPDNGGATTLVRKGANVTTNNFGGEGTGGQSYLLYNWQAGATYRFLTQAQADGDGTQFSAWFYAPEAAKWQFIATWRRPGANATLTDLYSFVENFLTDQGNITREAVYGNQWVYTDTNTWTEVTRALFTGDGTASDRLRLDYAGGTLTNQFYLKNGGFFSDYTPLYTNLLRTPTGVPPAIDFTSLP